VPIRLDIDALAIKNTDIPNADLQYNELSEVHKEGTVTD
jgi:hypothetical protein